MFERVKTPCIGVCSTSLGGDVCRGCKRFAHEVVNWNAYTNEQRYLIVSRLELHLAQVVKHKLLVANESLLKVSMQHQQIRFNADLDAHCWVPELLRAGAGQIDDVADYGLERQPGWESVSLSRIREEIDHDFFALSEAHFLRYIKQSYSGYNRLVLGAALESQ